MILYDPVSNPFSPVGLFLAYRKMKAKEREEARETRERLSTATERIKRLEQSLAEQTSARANEPFEIEVISGKR